MNSGPHDDSFDVSGRGLMFWLPLGGQGNGLDAAAWAEIADLVDSEATVVIPALTAAKIPAYLAMPHQRRASADPAVARRRLWVDSAQYQRAEEVLMWALARLRHARPPRPPPPLGDADEPLNPG